MEKTDVETRAEQPDAEMMWQIENQRKRERDLNVPSSSMDEPTSAYSEPSQGSTASFMDYFERAFSAEGILGSYVILPFDRDGFNNVIIYFGKSAEFV